MNRTQIAEVSVAIITFTCISCSSLESTADRSNNESGAESSEIMGSGSESRSVQTITIRGCAIKDAGIYRYREGMNLEDALKDAGGVTKAGSRKRVYVYRTIEGERLRGRLALDGLIKPDDIVVATCTYF